MIFLQLSMSNLKKNIMAEEKGKDKKDQKD
jgi:hypothetical protein